MTIKSVKGSPNGFEFSVACRDCRHEFNFSVPVTPPGPFDSRCPQCEQLYDLAKRDDEAAPE